MQSLNQADTDHTQTEAETETLISPTFKPQPKYEPRYLPLLRSIIQGNWDVVEELLDIDKDALKASISGSDTVLHVAVGQSNDGANRFVSKILNQLVEPEDLIAMVTESYNRTVLHEAALAGNLDAVKMVVSKNKGLLLVPDNDDDLPVHVAASFGHRDVSGYLLEGTLQEAERCPFIGDSSFSVLRNFIDAQFYDLAVKVVDRYPELATVIEKLGDEEKGDEEKGDEEKGDDVYYLFALGELARTPSSFYSGVRLNLLQRFLYHCIPIQSDQASLSKGQDIESVHDFETPKHQSCCSKLFGAESLVPCLKPIYNIKSKHNEATKLLECLCKKLEESDNENVTTIIRRTLYLAAEYGIVEIVEHLLKTFPFALWYTDDDDNYNILHVAILHRREKVFNLIYQMSECKFVATQSTDKDSNHSLHLAAQLAPPHRLDRIPGAALQMQHELQWFKEVKKFIKPSFIRARNGQEKTPQMIFSEAHKELVKEGEKWMNGMATSCITTAALLTTLAFAAAITIPGGNNNDGKPVFFHSEHQQIFLMFVVSNAISLFSSVGAIIMFLSILTSRYAEKDFLYALPMRLIFGLVSLFVSITSMMIAFGCALSFTLNQKQNWVLVLVGVLAFLPGILFVTLQFPLLMTMVNSTFGSALFGRQNKTKLY